MIYKDFNNINVSNFFGVSKIGNDTLVLAKYARKAKGKSVLDVGTGTGFVAIYFASLGKKVEGIDISLPSVQVAAKNARKNNLTIKFYQSNLFENVKGTFDIITFNPPIGTPTNSTLAPLIEKLKFILPKSTLLFKILMPIFGNQRRRIIKEFLKRAKSYLNKDGTIVILSSNKSELDLLQEYQVSLYNEDNKNIALLKIK